MDDSTHSTEAAEALRPTGKAEAGKGAEGEASRTRNKVLVEVCSASPISREGGAPAGEVGVAAQHGGQERRHW